MNRLTIVSRSVISSWVLVCSDMRLGKAGFVAFTKPSAISLLRRACCFWRYFCRRFSISAFVRHRLPGKNAFFTFHFFAFQGC